ncbi:MAG TPA: protein phosphatase 2C domain-containing protein [Bryobacteraceae bacterium]|nr:protein phosphatase 2C domain-containing protein [Bryobacteraceae bacterium]
MAVRAGLRHAARTDMGRRRTNNEDRLYVDPERGIYAVIDGVGGHAAGEHAAETAVEVLRERLERQSGTPEDRLREAIALANNEIYRLAHSNPEWAGMACVLTVALIEDDVVTVGHVGDSRLYLLRPGSIVKMTNDHSPIGEREDRGELSESEAMRHSRRNEIYRDVGSAERDRDDPAFMQILSFPMPADGAVLLCSDGLSDLVTSEEMRAGVERYAPDYEAAILALIGAANQAGGKDNITVVLVASPGYNPQPPVADEPSAVAEPPKERRWLFAAAGLVFGAALGVGVPRLWNQLHSNGPKTWTVDQSGINAAISRARPGDTVVIPEGKYREQIHLGEGVTVRVQQAGTVTVSSPGAGPAVVADHIDSGSIEGIRVLSDPRSPSAAGIAINDATVQVSNVYVTGAVVGIDIRGRSDAIVAASQIANNLGTGIDIAGGARPRLLGNLIAANGVGSPGPLKPGVEVAATARPVLKDNAIVDNAADAIWVHGHEFQPADYVENFFGGIPAKRAIVLIDEAETTETVPVKPGGRR